MDFQFLLLEHILHKLSKNSLSCQVSIQTLRHLFIEGRGLLIRHLIFRSITRVGTSLKESLFIPRPLSQMSVGSTKETSFAVQMLLKLFHYCRGLRISKSKVCEDFILRPDACGSSLQGNSFCPKCCADPVFPRAWLGWCDLAPSQGNSKAVICLKGANPPTWYPSCPAHAWVGHISP